MASEGEAEAEAEALCRYELLMQTTLGEIWKAKYGRARVIVKDTFDPEQQTSASGLCESSIAEEAIYRRLAHEKIFPELLGSHIKMLPRPVHTMVFERADNDLYNILDLKQHKQNAFGRITCRQRVLWCMRSCWIVHTMHKAGVADLDISLENMVVIRGRGLYFIDAGCAGVFERGDRLNAGQFPRWDGKKPGKSAYMHPAIYRGEEYDPFMADLYSLAIVLFLILIHGVCMLYRKVDDEDFKNMHKLGGLEKYVRALVNRYPERFPEAETKILYPMLEKLEGLMNQPDEHWLVPLLSDLYKLLHKC